MAMSLDGQTATAPGDSPWISGPQSRELVHRWRAEHDAIAIGIGTALADDPLLTARVEGARQPKRVVFDSQARLPLDGRLLGSFDQAPVLVAAAPDAPADRVAALEAAGAEVLVATDIEPALRELGRREVTSLFLEGGRTLASAFLAAGHLDESRTFVAPVLLGRQPEPDPPAAPERLAALESSAETVGDDVLITARFKEW